MQLLKRIPVIRTILRNMELSTFQRNWRKRNKHNQTFASSIFPTNIVTVGSRSYGMLNIYSYYPENEKLTIGNYVSIAPDVKFILGGNHQIQTLTSFPLKSFFTGKHAEQDSCSHGSIVVEDEVWIGINAIILSGVTLGKGAIVAAGAVVAKDVPPYAIVGGNPAKVIKYRFTKEVIEKLMPINLMEIPDRVLKESLPLLYEKITEPKDLDKILGLLNENNQHE